MFKILFLIGVVIEIPLVALLFECVDGFINGVYPGFNVDKKIYGIYAFCNKYLKIKCYINVFYQCIKINYRNEE